MSRQRSYASILTELRKLTQLDVETKFRMCTLIYQAYNTCHISDAQLSDDLGFKGTQMTRKYRHVHRIFGDAPPRKDVPWSAYVLITSLRQGEQEEARLRLINEGPTYWRYLAKIKSGNKRMPVHRRRGATPPERKRLNKQAHSQEISNLLRGLSMAKIALEQLDELTNEDFLRVQVPIQDLIDGLETFGIRPSIKRYGPKRGFDLPEVIVCTCGKEFARGAGIYAHLRNSKCKAPDGVKQPKKPALVTCACGESFKAGAPIVNHKRWCVEAQVA